MTTSKVKDIKLEIIGKAPASVPWEQLRADMIEAEADTIDAAIMALERLNGLFDTKGTVGLVTSCHDTLEVESANRRKQVEKLRNGS